MNRVDNFLNYGAPEGQRNVELFACACQVRDNGGSEGEAMSLLESKALSIGLTKTEVEKSISSAFAKAAREPAKNPNGDKPKSGGVLTYERKRYRVKIKADAMPKPMPDGTRQFLKAAFENDEFVCIVPADIVDGKSRPNFKTRTESLQDWLKLLDEHSGEFDSIKQAEGGMFIAINPLRDKDLGRKVINCGLRHCLVEFDGGELIDQWQTFVETNLPITAVIYSGGKSLHAWVRIDAQNDGEFKERVETLFEWLKENTKGVDLDEHTKDSARLSRLPGATRGDKGQDLLALNIGAKSWLDWEIWCKEQQLPAPFSLKEMLSFDPKDDPDTLIGDRWLCRGGSILWVGESGVGKSVMTTQAALSWAIGKPLFGVKPARPLRSLIVQAENSFGDVSEGLQGILGALPAKHLPAIANTLDENLLFVANETWVGEHFCTQLGKLISKHKPDLVWIDPLLSYLGGDISSNEHVGRFLRTWLNPILKATGAAAMVVHHTGKPPKERGKQSISSATYAGIGASELVNWARGVVTLQSSPDGQHEFDLTFAKRGKRAGLGSDVTVPVRHSTEGICWVRSNRQPETSSTYRPKY